MGKKLSLKDFDIVTPFAILDKYKDGPKEITNPISKKIIRVLIDNVMDIDSPETPREKSEGTVVGEEL